MKEDWVLQFRIDLKDISPPIWRRIQVPAVYTFWDLHVAISDTMGWLDCHLHEFEMKHPKMRTKLAIGWPDVDSSAREIREEREEIVSDWFSMENRTGFYLYDWGDNWNHKIYLERILPRIEYVTYPLCIKGKRACPPEDSGGPWIYAESLWILTDPGHPEYGDRRDWLGEDFDPEAFDIDEIVFHDPEMLWEIADRY